MTEADGGAVRCIGYVRVSTEHQAGEAVTSLADQERAIVQRAAALGLEVGRWFRDEGFSGATVDRRPGLLALLADCDANRRPKREGPPGVVLCLNDSRFGRFPDPEESAYWRVHLAKLGWIVRFVEGDETADKTMRSLMRALGSAQASEYREHVKKNAKRGARGTAGQGYWQKEAPLGTRRRVVYPPGRERTLERGVRKATDEKVALVPGPDAEVALVRWVFEAYASRVWSLGRIAAALVERVVRGECPPRRWHPCAVRRVLTNPAYAGDVVWGRHPADRDERAETPVRPESEWYGKRDAHPPLVSRVLFDRVQQLLAERALRPRARSDRYVLAGLLACAGCGQEYVGAGAARQRDGSRTRFYKCRGGTMAKYGGGAESRRRLAGDPGADLCPGPLGTVSAHLVEPLVVREVVSVVRHPATRRAVARELERLLAAEAAQPAVDLRALLREEHELGAKRARLVDAIADGTITKDDAAEQLAAIRSRLAMVSAERAEAGKARAVVRSSRDLKTERDQLLALVDGFEEAADALVAAGRGPELRELLRPWVQSLTFDKRTRVLRIAVRRVPEVDVVPIDGSHAVLPGEHSPRQMDTGKDSEAAKRAVVVRERRVSHPRRTSA